MNSMKTKTLIITQAMAAHLLSTAGDLANTTTDVSDIADADGFKITHEHAEHGTQCLMVDRIHSNLFSVSFAGNQDFMEMIGTDGWASSADALANYLLEQNPELMVDLAMFSYYELGDDFVVYSLVDESVIDINDPELAEMFASKKVDAAVEEILQTVEEVVEAAFAEETAAESTQTAEEATSETKPSWKERAIKFVRTPTGKVVSVVAIAAATVAAAAVVHSFFGEAAEISAA